MDLIIELKSSKLKDAPPIKPPSMSGLEKISSELLGFKLPPYKIGTELAKFLLNAIAISALTCL